MNFRPASGDRPRLHPTDAPNVARPPRMTGLRSLSRVLGGMAAIGAVVASLVAAPATPAYAAAAVSVHVEGQPGLTAVADPTYLTQLRVTGTGFQSVKNGFGGIYVMFGWVGSGWRPSQGGATGADYRYVPDDEAKPTGYISFVAFPGSSTADAANGGEVSADGSWSAVLDVPGAVFTSLDRNGDPTEVDCRDVQCGIITIGAHGVKNANNETFTPVDFRDIYADEAVSGGGDPETSDPGTSDPGASAVPTPAPTQTTVVIEEVAASPAPVAAASSDTTELLGILLWAVLGVGVLALAAIVFLVWAVLSARRRDRVPRPAQTSAGGE
jgi:hypothetical protein